MTPDEEVRRANNAERLFNDPMIQETLNLMEREINDAWLACPARDVDGREWLWRQAVSTRKFREILRGTMESGKIAKEQLRQKALEKEPLKDRTIRAFNTMRGR